MAATDEASRGKSASDALLGVGRFFTRWEESADGRAVFREGGRTGDVFYRDRWSHDKVVRSTHGVNCTGSCSWKVYVKDGIITWESQETDYPSVGPDRPEYEPRGCPRGAAFSWYTYSPTRVRYPYARGVLVEMYREARERLGTRCLPGPTSWRTRPGDVGISKHVARAAWSGCHGPRPSRWWPLPTCTRSRPTGLIDVPDSRRSPRCRWCRIVWELGSFSSSAE